MASINIHELKIIPNWNTLKNIPLNQVINAKLSVCYWVCRIIENKPIKPIIISEGRILIDGHHRLYAIKWINQYLSSKIEMIPFIYEEIDED